MPQYTAVFNTNPSTKTRYPLLLEIQSDLLSELTTTIVIPLAKKETLGNAKMTRLNPEFTIESETYVAVTQQLAGVSRDILGDVAFDLKHLHSDIVSAVDFVISGV